MKKTTLIVLVLIALSFAASIYYYSQMPDKIASHWNAAGEVDGYMSSFWGLFMFPIIAIGLFLLFHFLPRFDKRINDFRKYYDWFAPLIVAFLIYIHLLIIFTNRGYAFNMTLALIPAFAAMFFGIGAVLGKTKRNLFVGIRTPWTLGSDVVWDKTHQLGGKMFKAAGVVTLFGLFNQEYAFWLLIAPVLLATFYTLIYSYVEYRKQIK